MNISPTYALPALALCVLSWNAHAGALTAEEGTAAQKAFRNAHLAKIQQQGWKFVTSSGVLEWPDNDVFFQDVRKKDGTIRTVWVLIAQYELARPWLNTRAPYQSTRALYWIDCNDLSYEYRQGASYLNADGTGLSSDSTAIPTSQAATLQESAPGSLLRLLATKTCELPL
jgi:hypothetical protein